MSSVAVSIIVPTFNSEKTIRRLLDGLFSYDGYVSFEVIVVDRLSKDNTVGICREYDTRCFDNPKVHAAAARNIGIMQATGDYIICLDSDDWLKNENVLKDINDNLNGEDIMFLGFELGKNGEEELYPFRPNFKTMYDAFIDDVCAIWTKVVRTELLQDTLFPESTLAEDRVHHYRLCDKAHTFTCLNQSTHVWNRSNPTSVTTKREAMWEMSIYKHLGEMYYFIRTTNNDKYREWVQKKFDFQWNELAERRYHQR